MPRMEEIFSRLIIGWNNLNSSALTGMKIHGKKTFDNIEESTNEIVSLNLEQIGGYFHINFGKIIF